MMDCAVAGRTRPEHCNASDEESKRKQFHDGEHGVKVEEGGPQQSGRVAGEGGSRACSALQVPSGVFEKEGAIALHGWNKWLGRRCLYCLYLCEPCTCCFPPALGTSME